MQISWFLKVVMGIIGLIFLGGALLLGVVMQIDGNAAASQANGCGDSSTTGSLSPKETAPATEGSQAGSCLPASPYGAAVVAWARQMADALYVNPACGRQRGGNCNDTWYTSAFPQAVLAYGQRWCQAHGDCADWANGSYQCVSFVRGAYSQVYPMTATNDAFGLWATYRSMPDWQEIPAAATAEVARRALPEPGDVMVFRDRGVGHVAIVMAVQPPQPKTAGWIAFTNANSSSAYDRMPLLPDLQVDTSAWASSGQDYVVWGYLRPRPALAPRVVRINQLDPAQYASTTEWQLWAYSACSAAAMTEVLNAYGLRLRIHDVLAVESARKDIDPALGLTNDGGIADTLGQFGFQTNWGEHWSLPQVIQTANRGLPVIVGWPPARYDGGHLVVVTGGDLMTGIITLADSSSWNRRQVSVTQFQQWWAGFAAVATPAGS